MIVNWAQCKWNPLANSPLIAGSLRDCLMCFDIEKGKALCELQTDDGNNLTVLA